MRKKKGQYWIFAFDGYYPCGGMQDYQFSFNTIEEFEEEILSLPLFEFYQVLNIDNHYDFQGDLGTVTTWICKNIGEEKYEQ